MPVNRSVSRLPLHPGPRICIALIAVISSLAVAAAPAVADTGSVYYVSNLNVGAGHDFFNGTFTGTNNVGLGYSVMPSLTSGFDNTATGLNALFSNTSGAFNVATGASALYSNTGGRDNVASGFRALFKNHAGRYNVAAGTNALYRNGGGDANLAVGFSALYANTQGNNNIALGYQALDNTTGSSNIALGSTAGASLTTGSDNIDIANPGVAGESGTIRIGGPSQTAAFLAGVYGKTIGGPTQGVVVNSAGRLGTAPAPAAPLNANSQAVRRLHQENRHQNDQLQQLRSIVQRLREQVREGG